MNVMKKAKSMRKQFPKMPWKKLVKKAGKEVKRRNRQTGRSDKKADEQRSAKRPGKRRSRSGSNYIERRKNRSDVPGTLTGIRSTAKEKLGKALTDHYLATTRKGTIEAQERITKWKRILRATT